MQYTEKLNLPILEGTDSMSNLATQGNAIANQLESIVGANIENIEAVPELFNTVTEQGNDIEALEGRVEILEDLQTKETVKIGETTRVLTKHIVKVEATMDGSIVTTTFKATNDTDDQRHRMDTFRGTVSIDLTELLGVADETDILLQNVITYQNGYQYQANRNALPMDVLCVGKYPNSSHVHLVLTSTASSCFQQHKETVGVTEIWSPSSTPAFSTDQTVIVVFEYYELT